MYVGTRKFLCLGRKAIEILWWKHKCGIVGIYVWKMNCFDVIYEKVEICENLDRLEIQILQLRNGIFVFCWRMWMKQVISVVKFSHCIDSRRRIMSECLVQKLQTILVKGFICMAWFMFVGLIWSLWALCALEFRDKNNEGPFERLIISIAFWEMQ